MNGAAAKLEICGIRSLAITAFRGSHQRVWFRYVLLWVDRDREAGAQKIERMMLSVSLLANNHLEFRVVLRKVAPASRSGNNRKELWWTTVSAASAQ